MINKTTAILIAVLAFSCGDGTYKKAEDAQDAGRQFIRASLDGDYKRAKFYLLQDETNLRFFEKSSKEYNQLSQEAKRANREAVIRPVAITPINDSLTQYSYYHTANAKDTVTLQIVKSNNDWLFDLKSIQ
jgi:hypothetical protein